MSGRFSEQGCSVVEDRPAEWRTFRLLVVGQKQMTKVISFAVMILFSLRM